MPKYDYKCQKCARLFEVERSMHDDTIVYCPQCEIEAVQIFTPFTVHYFGEGFTRNNTPNLPTNRRQAGKLWKSQSR